MNLLEFSPYSRVPLFWNLIVNQRECMTCGISYGTLMSQSQEIGLSGRWHTGIQSNKQEICVGMFVILIGTVGS